MKIVIIDRRQRDQRTFVTPYCIPSWWEECVCTINVCGFRAHSSSHGYVSTSGFLAARSKIKIDRGVSHLRRRQKTVLRGVVSHILTSGQQSRTSACGNQSIQFTCALHVLYQEQRGRSRLQFYQLARTTQIENDDYVLFFLIADCGGKWK